MNFADSEVVASILTKEGYNLIDDSKKANLVLAMLNKMIIIIMKRIDYTYRLVEQNNSNYVLF